MNQKNIHNLLIIDASGSMGDKIPEVTGGINQIFNDLKNDEKNDSEVTNKTTVVDFSSHGDFNVLYGSATPSELVQLKPGDYTTRSMTALYDAIGKAFQLVPKNNDGVFVTIFTDGLENDSKEFKSATIRKLIKSKEDQGWTITYMGTNEEAIIQAESIGITRDKSLMYQDSKLGTSKAFKFMGSARQKYASAIKNKMKVEDIFDKKKNEKRGEE